MRAKKEQHFCYNTTRCLLYSYTNYRFFKFSPNHFKCSFQLSLLYKETHIKAIFCYKMQSLMFLYFFIEYPPFNILRSLVVNSSFSESFALPFICPHLIKPNMWLLVCDPGMRKKKGSRAISPHIFWFFLFEKHIFAFLFPVPFFAKHALFKLNWVIPITPHKFEYWTASFEYGGVDMRFCTRYLGDTPFTHTFTDC